jgi:cell fate (sporulation/competence/biofilm development) regulator YmcA (YheA/YmcA/DUF963 family)
VWTDRNAAQFDELHLQPLWEDFQTALPAIAQLVQVIQAAGRELEE